MDVNPYLMFNGRCEQALEFYKQAVGAQDVHIIASRRLPRVPRCPARSPTR
jgi:PhnB protein